MFQFPAFPVHLLTGDKSRPVSRFGDPRIKACLTATRGLSQLCHDLHRLWTPRHPPCTLLSLTTLFLVLLVADAFLEPSCFQRTTSPWARKPRVMPFLIPWVTSPCPHVAGSAQTHSVESSRSTAIGWWRRPDSNRRPPGCKPGALPAELRPHWCVLHQPLGPGKTRGANGGPDRSRTCDLSLIRRTL